MARRVNIFGQPLSYDVAVDYVDEKPVPRSRLINPERDDVSDVTKKTVVKYTEDLTHGVEGNRSNANTFPVGGDPKDVSLQTSDGTTPALSVASNPDGQYVPPFTTASRVLESYSDSSQVALSGGEPALDKPGDASFVKKGKSKGGEVDGHRLLSDANANPDPKVVEKYVSPILSNNRFSAERKMSTIVGNDKKFNPNHPQEGFGSYKRHRNLGTDMTDGQVANVGPMLTLRATKELDSISSTGYGKAGPDGTGAKAASLLPGLAQVGAARVTTEDLQVDSVLRALIEGDTEGVNVNDGEDGPRKVISMNTSYGQMNNVLEQFSGLLPLGMVAAGAALAIALNVAIRAVLAVFMLITNASSSNSQKRDDIGRFIPGDSRYNPAFNKVSFPPVPIPAKLFGLVETVNPYGDAVNEGIKVFFGGDVGKSLSRVLETPGFYVTFSRTIVRSAVDLVRILEDVGRGNPIQIAENIVSFVDAIKSSKVVAVMNMFAQIGDVSLIEAVRLSKYTKDSPGHNDSEIDNLEGLDAMRNRKPGSLALAWGAASTKSILLLPETTGKAMMTGRPGALTTLLSTNSETEFKLSNSNKLSAETVASVEDALNAEYLPFYFHDLRTNEIVSFQAFLSNLSEDYSANYDSIDGYGRIDSVKMYRSTARKLSIAFYVAATNHDDFDAMWVKINKLVTLMYPQWSNGTLLSDKKDHFIQPFSQIPSASPLIRLRVGDLWTSNYSKFSLARIFGLGNDSTFKVGDSSNTANVSEMKNGLETALQRIRDNNKELQTDWIFLLEPGDYDASPKDQGALGAAASALASVANAVGVKTPTNARVTAHVRTYTRVKIKKALNTNAYAVEIIDKEGLPKTVADSQFIVSRSHLAMNEDTLTSMGEAREKSDTSDPLDDNQSVDKIVKLSQFFSADNNALVRAFEASKGRGVACFVESMGFDWMDGGNVMWETAAAGSRAPKMCKITMNMAVVHDIAPGIDASGFNRAPVYNVGPSSNAMAGRSSKDEGTAFTTAVNKLRKSLI